MPSAGWTAPSSSTANWSCRKRPGSRSSGSHSGCTDGVPPRNVPRPSDRLTMLPSTCSIWTAEACLSVPTSKGGARWRTCSGGRVSRRPGRCGRQPMMRRWPAGGWPGQRPAWRAVCSRTAAEAIGQGRAPGGSVRDTLEMVVGAVTGAPRRPGSCCSAGTTRRDDYDIWDVRAPCQPPRPEVRAASYARCRRITRGPGGPSLPVGDHSRS